MKRLIIVACAVGMLVALPLSHMAMAGPPDKVILCHVNSGNVESLDVGPRCVCILGNRVSKSFTVGFGKITAIIESRVDAHMEDHGDRRMMLHDHPRCIREFLVFEEGKAVPLTDEVAAWLQIPYDTKLSNADCVFVKTKTFLGGCTD